MANDRIRTALNDLLDEGGVLIGGIPRSAMAAIAVAMVAQAGIMTYQTATGVPDIVSTVQQEVTALNAYVETPIAIMNRDVPDIVPIDLVIEQMSAFMPDGASHGNAEPSTFELGGQCVVIGAHPAMTGQQILYREDGLSDAAPELDAAIHGYVLDRGVGQCMGLQPGGELETFAVIKGLARGVGPEFLAAMQKFHENDPTVSASLVEVSSRFEADLSGMDYLAARDTAFEIVDRLDMAVEAEPVASEPVSPVWDTFGRS